MHRFIALLVVFAFPNREQVGQADTQSSRARKPAVEMPTAAQRPLFTVTAAVRRHQTAMRLWYFESAYRFFIEVPQGVQICS